MSNRAPLIGVVLFTAATLALAASAPVAAAQGRSRNVVLFTLDGLRWQDLFRGADPDLLTEEAGGVADVEALRAAFWRDTENERRRAMMPFFWDVVATGGQVFGNVDRGGDMKVTNGMIFSYPGYNEMLTGYPDARIDSNDKVPNPNVTVLEWLNRRPGFEGKVAAFTAWDVFPFIVNEERSGVLVNGGVEAIEDPGGLTANEVLLNDLMKTSFQPTGGVRDDALTFHAALEYLRKHGPRVLFISLDRTDTSSHNRRYDRYLAAARQSDDMLRRLWETLQSLPQYAGQTSLVITTDHGRGEPPDDWRSHGDDVPGAASIWLAVIGPDTLPLGDRAAMTGLTQSQVAATVAALVGEDYPGAVPRAAAPIPGIIRIGQ